MKIGSHYLGNGRCEFVVWVPLLYKVEVKIVSPSERLISMQQNGEGYWKAVVNDIVPGTLYYYRLDKKLDRPDPASFFQPEGVHGPSQVIDHTSFHWKDNEESWQGIRLNDLIIYELHVGTFTPQGTFEAIVPRLDELARLGINAVELMPVGQFPGERNWGYDGVYPYAVQNSYGGPEKLKELVNECHKRGISVILDVVYNHLGPEGNYLGNYGPYFSGKYTTSWGSALNFDEAYSDEVRNFFIENAIYWFKHFRIDALRLDAIHAIYDMSAFPFLQELAQRVKAFSTEEGRKFYLIAESALNDIKVTGPKELGGYGIAAQWCDDFHHALHTLLTGETQGYYIDFGKVHDFEKALREGFVYSGQYSRYRKRRFGNCSKDVPAHQFVVFAQNHDQIGNRMLGERLSNLVSFEALKLAAGVVFLSPYIPLLFMGEEYGEKAPFLYFVDHSDPSLIEAVRQGRKEEFKRFGWKSDPPDAQSEETFLNSKIDWKKRQEGKHGILLDFYKKLIRLRNEIPALSPPDKEHIEILVIKAEKVVLTRRWNHKDDSHALCIFNFNKDTVTVPMHLPEGSWNKKLDSSDTVWNGPGSSIPKEIPAIGEITLNGNSVVLFCRSLDP
ncbi:MAG: malto-oligosyltrehalose trehalohydrolase [Pseudomonadota bacterium]